MSKQRFITVRIPIIDTGNTVEQKRRKMQEELDELLDEFSVVDVDLVKAFAEFFDVAQVMAGYALCRARETAVAGNAVHDYVQTQFKHANAVHLSKIMEYARERGWQVIEE